MNKNKINKLTNMLKTVTKGCVWYHDTLERTFETSPYSHWLINPKTKQWVFELDMAGHLFYFHKLPETMGIKQSDFESIIKMWVEKELKVGFKLIREVSIPHDFKTDGREYIVKDVLKNGKKWN